MQNHKEGMLDALDKAPKIIARQSCEEQNRQHSPTYYDDCHVQNEDSIFPTVAVTCHSTPSKKQSALQPGSHVKVRNNSLPLNHNMKSKNQSHYYSYGRRNSMESDDIELAYSSESIIQERRLEFERRRRQVQHVISLL